MKQILVLDQAELERFIGGEPIRIPQLDGGVLEIRAEVSRETNGAGTVSSPRKKRRYRRRHTENAIVPNRPISPHSAPSIPKRRGRPRNFRLPYCRPCDLSFDSNAELENHQVEEHSVKIRGAM